MSDTNKTPSAEHTDRPDEGIHRGVPEGVTQEDANALPHSDRQASETAGTPQPGASEAPPPEAGQTGNAAN